MKRGISYIQQLLGHASLSTTQIYTRVSIRRLQSPQEDPSGLRKGRRGMNAAHRISKLEKSRNTAMLEIMNAAQIIEEIQRLPEEEKGKVVDFLRNQPNAETIAAMEEPIDDLPRYKTMDELTAAIKGLVHDA